MKQPSTYNQRFAVAMSFFSAALLATILFVPSKVEKEIQNAIIICFTGTLTGCLGYLIGSSHGSQMKDNALSSSIPSSEVQKVVAETITNVIKDSKLSDEKTN
jgi:hypothetical protein